MVPQDRFYVWARQGSQTFAGPLPAESAETASLFPLTWKTHPLDSCPLVLESVSFSPLLPGNAPERSLPLHLIAFRAHNPTAEPIEAALMLTWVAGWPELIPDAAFDFQHDNLCLTGSLGSPGSPNRQGIAVPDLHYAGIYQQGIEPWIAPREEAEIVEDFAEDGELDPRVVRSAPHGNAPNALRCSKVASLLDFVTKETIYVLLQHKQVRLAYFFGRIEHEASIRDGPLRGFRRRPRPP